MFRPVPSNRLSMINLATGGTRGFTYDASGSVTAEARPGGTYGYTYNAAGRMSEFLINGILQASYRYDAMERQAIRTLSSPTAVTIYSVFDSDGRRIAEYNETSGALIREYVWNGWDPVAVIEGGVISFVRADHIGRPVFATNATGAKTWTATYTPFGGVHTSTGALPTARFPGQWFQSESGLHQNWMRDYDPTTGRYLQADPLGLVDGASVYGYVKQSPMRFMDPTGQFFVPGAVFGAIIGGYSAYNNNPCWQSVVAGMMVGGFVGGFMPGKTVLGTAILGFGEASIGQLAGNWAASLDPCDCNPKSTWNLVGSAPFWINNGFGAFAGGAGPLFGGWASAWAYGGRPYFSKGMEAAADRFGEVATGGFDFGVEFVGNQVSGAYSRYYGRP
jgi:RHS repeat-associated protein